MVTNQIGVRGGTGGSGDTRVDGGLGRGHEPKQHETCARFDHTMRTQKFGQCVAGRSFLSLFEAEVAGRAKSWDNVEPMNQLRFVSVLAQLTVSIK